MDAGEVVDMETHEELIARSGRYAEMWDAQVQWYERGNRAERWTFAKSVQKVSK